MSLSAFTAPGTFRRGNIHTHSTRSDGALSPDAVAAAYAAEGYDFLCLSDHFVEKFGWPIVDPADVNAAGLTLIPGAEIHAPANSHGEAWHVLACGLPLDFRPPTPDERMEDLAARAAAAGAFVAIAHPQWSQLSIEDGRALAGIVHSVEIYNTGCDLECARPDGCYLLDELLNEGHRHLSAYAADDAHFRIPDGFGGWVMVKSEGGDAASLVAALRRGDFYATQGPEIRELSVTDGALRVEVSAVRNIGLVGRGSRSENLFGTDLTAATLPLARFAGDWCRLVVTDGAGRHAWTNPIWVD